MRTSDSADDINYPQIYKLLVRSFPFCATSAARELVAATLWMLGGAVGRQHMNRTGGCLGTQLHPHGHITCNPSSGPAGHSAAHMHGHWHAQLHLRAPLTTPFPQKKKASSVGHARSCNEHFTRDVKLEYSGA